MNRDDPKSFPQTGLGTVLEADNVAPLYPRATDARGRPLAPSPRSGDYRLSSIETNGRVRTMLTNRDFGANLLNALRTGLTGGVIAATLIRVEDKTLTDFFFDPALFAHAKEAADATQSG